MPPMPRTHPIGPAGFRVDGVDVHLDERGNPRIVERRFVVEEDFQGLRLDHYLKRKIPRLSRTKLQLIIRTQLTREDGRVMKPHSPVCAGDVLFIRRPARPEPPCPREFEVIYEDEHMLAVNKPAGLPMHASAKFYFNTLTRVLSERYPDEEAQICHRIDRETSGIVLVARSKTAAASLKQCFAKKRVNKSYLAIIHGTPDWPDDTCTVDLPLGLVEDADALIDIRMEVRDNGLPSTTQVHIVERRRDYALVRCHPITGRQHQIRAHLAAVGYPIVGDKLYAHGDEAFAAYCDGRMTSELLEQFQLPRQALHAASITIPHPATGDAVTIECALPGDLRQFLDAATPC